MSVKLLTEQHLEFLCLKGGCTGSPKSTLVKMSHCWKPNVMAQMVLQGHSNSPTLATHMSLNLESLDSQV